MSWFNKKPGSSREPSIYPIMLRFKLMCTMIAFSHQEPQPPKKKSIMCCAFHPLEDHNSNKTAGSFLTIAEPQPPLINSVLTSESSANHILGRLRPSKLYLVLTSSFKHILWVSSVKTCYTVAFRDMFIHPTWCRKLFASFEASSTSKKRKPT